MANVFDDLHRLTHTPEAIAARHARRDAKRTQLLDRIGEAMGRRDASAWDTENAHLEQRPLGAVHPGTAATVFVREALSQFELPDLVKVSYSGMKRQSGSGAHHMRDGVVMVTAEVASVSGAKHHLDVPVMVHDNHMVFPEIFMHNGRVRVMAQSAFDEIIKGGEVMRPSRDRAHMYSTPPSAEDTARTRAEPHTPYVGAGLYGIRAALRGYTAQVEDKKKAQVMVSRADLYNFIQERDDGSVSHEDLAAEYAEQQGIDIEEVLHAMSEMGFSSQHVAAMLDPAEADRTDHLQPGQSIKLSGDVTLKGRGGATMQLKSGTKGTVIRDMFGTGQVYYVEFENGRMAPINWDDIG